MKFDSKKFGFTFFLSGKKQVSNLEQAAKQYGGATKNLDTGETFSNIPGNDFIELKNAPELNTFSLYIPDTMNVNQTISKAQHQEIVFEIVHRIYKRYGNITPEFNKGLGSWYSEELNQVVYDNLVIASIHLEFPTQADIRFFISLAKNIKKSMKQEAVTITVNNSMGLI